jgi:hypothetical protein
MDLKGWSRAQLDLRSRSTISDMIGLSDIRNIFWRLLASIEAIVSQTAASMSAAASVPDFFSVPGK